jgi:hypothetical protein
MAEYSPIHQFAPLSVGRYSGLSDIELWLTPGMTLGPAFGKARIELLGVRHGDNFVALGNEDFRGCADLRGVAPGFELIQ